MHSWGTTHRHIVTQVFTLDLSGPLILFVPVIDLFISKCQVAYHHICSGWSWCVCAVVRPCLCAHDVHSPSGFGCTRFSCRINIPKGRQVYVLLHAHVDPHENNADSIRGWWMSGVLALLPFAIATHTIKDFLVLALYYMSERKVGTGSAIERETYSCWKDKKWIDSCSFTHLFLSQSEWLINNADVMWGGLVCAGQDLVRMSLWGFLKIVTALFWCL